MHLDLPFIVKKNSKMEKRIVVEVEEESNLGVYGGNRILYLLFAIEVSMTMREG